MRLTPFMTSLTLAAMPLAADAPAAPAPPSILGFAVTGSATLGTQYIFRGLTQTDGKPTVQAEVDFARTNGWYLSVAASNISWFTDQNTATVQHPAALGGASNSAGVEVDLFGGYKWSPLKDLTVDLGLYRYFYPGTYTSLGAFAHPETTEAYLGVSYFWASVKYSKVLSAADFGVTNAQGTTYGDLSLSYPLGESGWSLLGHVGKTTLSGAGNDIFSYTDTKVGVAKEVKGTTFALALTHADTKAVAADRVTPIYQNAMGRNIGGSRVTLTVAKAF